MSSHIVVFLPDGACVEAASEQTILEVAAAAGVAIDSACGGQGTCGKCKVMVTLGQPGGRPGEGISPEERERGFVLACQSTVADDLVVEVPVESQRGELQILLQPASGGLEAAPAKDDVPLAQSVGLRLDPPDRTHNLGDGERLLGTLSAQLPGRFTHLEMDLPVLRSLPRLGRQQDWRLEALVGDFDGRGVVFGLAPEASRPGDGAPTEGAGGPSYGLAIDLGTTTVVVHLIELATGGVTRACASLNDQITYGEDVISRIIYSQEHPQGLARARDAARQTINRCLREVTEAHGVQPEQIIAAAIVGNTVMTHLLLGIDASAIRREPYVPAVRSLPVLRAAEVGVEIHPAAPVFLAPCVSSYVGGDMTAGVLATAIAESPQLTLFIDLGTNGEMVVGDREWLMCCSCSAGPAFEGSGLEYGMYATIGAIERLRYHPEADRVEYATIGNARPRGLCGSGLVDVLATLLRASVLDRRGRINLGFPSPRVRVRRERPEFVVVWGEEAGRSDDISLGEDDIQNLIRSKSAVYAGAATLLESVGIEASSLERILVAGAFGNYLDAENAVTIGLLPDIPLDRIRFVGNTAVAGARSLLLGRQARAQAGDLARRMTNFELSIVPGYMDRYVAGLFLPHTDLSLFPSVARRLELAV
jgi:uncharacterized 2Fe-2S/4Fe-4S cluster protein (DUF4445 family)